jgi:hypothetical protein
MARKQNFAGVVKEKRTGRTWAASGENAHMHLSKQGIGVTKTYHHKPADELEWDQIVSLFRSVKDTLLESHPLRGILMDQQLYVPWCENMNIDGLSTDQIEILTYK